MKQKHENAGIIIFNIHICKFNKTMYLKKSGIF